LEYPEKIKNFIGKNVFLVAATLRPETMYGQTNCYVLPEGEYGVYAMKNDEYYICSERAARNFAF
jgi:leucyl-tRNA synthetase